MQRGPKSAESQVVYVVPEAIPQRPEPPDYLSVAQKTQWNLYVERMPVDWFTAEVQPLLVNLCRAVCLSDYFMARLTEVTTDLVGLETRLRQENPGISDKELRLSLEFRQGQLAEYTRLHLEQAKQVKSLSTALRLTPQSRYQPNTASARARDVPKRKPWET
jgi:hypothetical protein